MSEMDRYLGRIYGSLTKEPEMTNDERVKALGEHVTMLQRRHGDLPVTKGILADPQAHVDALVAAGVLRPGLGSHASLYSVVQPEPPHEHSWRVWLISGDNAHVVCTGCPETSVVPNKLPIEVPS